MKLLRRERRRLQSYCADLAQRLEADDYDTDEVVASLFPVAYADDAESNAAFDCRFRPSLRAEKLKALCRTADTAGETSLDDSTADAWLRALTDLRFVYGAYTNPEITTVRRFIRQLTDPFFREYVWLTATQFDLVDAIAA